VGEVYLPFLAVLFLLDSVCRPSERRCPRGCSVLSLHLVAPRTVHGDSDEIVPSISQGTHGAELAVDCVGSDQWIASDDAGFPVRLALWAAERSLVEAIVVAVLATPGWECVSNSTIHVDLQDPIADLVSLSLGKQVLLREWDLIRHWNVSSFEVSVLLNHVAIRVLNCIPQVDIAVEENERHVILIDLAVGIAGVQECFISSDILAVSEQRGAEFSVHVVEVVLVALGLQ